MSMQFFDHATKHNELFRINVAHVVALHSFINDEGTSARFEIHTTSPTLTIVQEFDDVDKMKEEFERVERLIMSVNPRTDSKTNVIRARGYNSEQDKPQKLDNWSLKP